MPEYLAPGVYVEEVDTGAKPIEGVSTSTSGMVGVTERGPVGVPTLVASYPDFVRQFGGYLDDRVYKEPTWYLPHAVEGFFTNGGKRVYIVRVLPPSATTAGTTLFDHGATADAAGVTFTRFTRALAARVERGDQILLLDDTPGPSAAGADWALVEDGRASEYIQFASSPVGVVSIATPTRAALWTTGTPITGFANFDGGGATVGSTILAADVARNEFILPVANAGPLAGSQSYRIGTGPTQELHNAADNGAVALVAPLALNHNPTPVVGTAQWTDPVTRTLTAAVAAPPPAVTTIALDNRTLLVGAPAPGAGQRLRITGGGNTEIVRIATIVAPRAAAPDAGNVTVAAPLMNGYPAGATVELLDAPTRNLMQVATKGTTRVTLDNRVGILDPAPPGRQVHFLQFTDPAGNSEFARIDTVVSPRVGAPDPGPISLEWALQRDYPAGSTVTLLRDTDNDTNPTYLAWDVDPSDEALLLGDSGAYGAGSYIRIEAIDAANSEYSQVPSPAPTPALRVLAALLGNAHAAATPVLGRSPLLKVQAIDPGTWGNKLRVIADRESNHLLRETSPVTPRPATSPTLTLQTAVAVEAGSILEFFSRTGVVETVVFRQKAASVAGNVVAFAGGLQQDVTANMLVRTVEFLLRVELVRENPRTRQEEVVTDEQFRQLSMDPRHSRYVVRVLGPIFINDTITPRRADGRTEGESPLIRVKDVLYPNWPQDDPTASAQAEGTLRAGPDILQIIPPRGPARTIGQFFSGGSDDIGAISPATYIGSEGTNPPQSRTGISALKNIEEIAIVAVPGQTDPMVQQTLLDHCDLTRYRFAVLDSDPQIGIAEVQDQRSLYDSKYGALYYPWLRIADPFPDNPRTRSQVSIPPSGHVIGVYARSDIERGVHKAPANEVIRGILDLEVSLTKEEQDILNPRNINVLRNFRRINRGLRVWGARTVSSDTDWKYLNVRRVFIFVEYSIDRGTQWVVFEPNDERLWARVRRSVTDFLTTVWRNGALQGLKPEEGFFVKCDRETMTEDDINNGRLIVLVGLAVVRPAEFVIFRIGQSRRGSELFEGA